ncbi:hypothetical protein [Candidatus Nitrosocosmicus hydrocola]|uniref:hypothetical protein n=1 Tax=Candidatus Nitrosocosmicus hydrocola TaxID=1826872 RepID=UPI0011E5BA7A|nr:hypothetical protein [Candidatus Nitrosocosmicus hydrocola]
MINNSNSTKRSTDSKTKKDNKDDASGSTKNTKKASAIDSPASKATANLTTLTAAKSNDSKTKKDNKDDASGSTKNKSNSILPLKLDELKKEKNDNEQQQLSYYEKQVLKELKGIRKASKNILKTIKKFNN